MQTTKSEKAWWLAATGVLGFILLFLIVRQDPKIIRTLRSSPAARGQLQAVAQELVERSKTSGKKKWVRSDADFPAEAKALGIKACQIFNYGEVVTLKVPVSWRRVIIVHPKNLYTVTGGRRYDGATGFLGDGVFVKEDFDESDVTTVDSTGLQK